MRYAVEGLREIHKHCRIFFSDNTSVRIFIFLSRKARIFFPESNITLYDKNSESNYFFFLHQNQNILFSNIGNQNIFLEKNHKLIGPSLIFVHLGNNNMKQAARESSLLGNFRYTKRSENGWVVTIGPDALRYLSCLFQSFVSSQGFSKSDNPDVLKLFHRHSHRHLFHLKKYMLPPLPYFKVNICPFTLPHFASIFFAYLWSIRWPNYNVTLQRYFFFRLPHLNIPNAPPSDQLDKNIQ